MWLNLFERKGEKRCQGSTLSRPSLIKKLLLNSSLWLQYIIQSFKKITIQALFLSSCFWKKNPINVEENNSWKALILKKFNKLDYFIAILVTRKFAFHFGPSYLQTIVFISGLEIFDAKWTALKELSKHKPSWKWNRRLGIFSLIKQVLYFRLGCTIIKKIKKIAFLVSLVSGTLEV